MRDAREHCRARLATAGAAMRAPAADGRMRADVMRDARSRNT
jgi:hypothetical protein